jgi:tellurite resistance protein
MGHTIDLSAHPPERLSAAIRDVLTGAPDALGGRLPSAEHLRQGAEAVTHDQPGSAAVHFQSLLEIGYLIASADGFAEEERHALATLLEAVLGRAVSHDDLELHFKDLDAAVEILGRRERLRRAAEDFEDDLGRSEALGFAALVAVADGHLAEPEASALDELGSFLGLEAAEVEAAIDRVVGDIKSRLADKEGTP